MRQDNPGMAEQQQTAVWVTVRGQGYCLRYYASGLGHGDAVVAAWLHGDIGGSKTGPSGHQKGLGPAAMIEQERQLAQRSGHAKPGRPGEQLGRRA